MPDATLPAFDAYPFDTPGAEAWAARIAAETKGRATADSLTRPAEDGTLLRPYYLDAGAPAPALRRSPGWQLIEDLSELSTLAPVADVVRSSVAWGADGLLVSDAALAEAEALLGSYPSAYTLYRLTRPDAVGVDAPGRRTVHALIRYTDATGRPLLSGNHWTYRRHHSLWLDLLRWAEVGADAAQQLGVLLAWLRDELVRLQPTRLWLNVGVGLSLPVELAKLRAARALVTRHLPQAQLSLHATTARWPLSRREPHTNLVRTTVQAFTAVAAGADALSLYPYDGVSGLPSADGVRWARATSHLLRHESHLGAVADPGAGSHAFEALSDELLTSAERFAEGIAAAGGYAQALASGWLGAQVQQVARARAAAIAAGDAKTGQGRVFVGVNAFRAPGEVLPSATDAYADRPDLSPWRGPAGVE